MGTTENPGICPACGKESLHVRIVSVEYHSFIPQPADPPEKDYKGWLKLCAVETTDMSDEPDRMVCRECDYEGPIPEGWEL